MVSGNLVQKEIKTTQLTDVLGWPLVFGDDAQEPECGSILMVDGWWGTAWQRLFIDGQWHSSRGGTPRSWKQLLKRKNVILIYDASKR